jgi:aminopeptidase N
MKKTAIAFLLLLLALQSCRYRPYLKYYFPSQKTHTARFTNWEKMVGSNSNPLRASYNITCYDWTLHVHPEQKKIDALMKITFRMELDQDSILLDLERHLTVDTIQSSVPLKKTKQKKDALFVVFDRTLKTGESVSLEISYHGKPVKMLSYTAINWGEDQNGKPWICTATEGIGTHHLMPCKNLLSDEPDSCFIRVGVPKDLVGVANGKLDRVTETESENIYHWAVRNPINIYNISFNVGDYVKLEKDYRDIHHTGRKIEIYALSYNKETADTFYNQAPVIMQQLEQLYGEYPWWNDGCKIIETSIPNGLCMEHQSGISMTDAYKHQFMGINYTLVHELSHEWWGNSLTAYDYADLWLHEGFAQYSEALVVEALHGTGYYHYFIDYYASQINNKRPVAKPYDVRYNNLVHHEDQDIYDKGALFIHTLRRQLNNDTLFFKVLKTAQQQFSKDLLTSDQFLAYFNQETNKDFTPFFNVYLHQISPPILEYHINNANGQTATLAYRWKEKLPAGFNMKVMANIGEKLTVIYPTSELQQLTIPANQKCTFAISLFGYVLVEERKDDF